MASCSSEGKEEGKTAESTGLDYAYFNQDSLLTQFTFYKDEMDKLEVKAKEFEAKMIELQTELERKASNFQRQVDAGLLSANAQASKQAELQQIQGKMQVLQQTDGADLEVENQKMTESFFEKLQNYSKEYAEEKGFKAIFAKTEMGGPIVYMDESADITMDFIKYMNEKEKSAK